MVPLLVAGTVAKVAGDLLSRKTAQDNAKSQAAARNRVLSEYRGRQNELAEEARGYFDTRLNDFTPVGHSLALTGAQTLRSDGLVKNMTAPDPGSVTLSRSAPPAVRGEVAKRMLTAFNGATDRAKALGRLGGYNDTWSDNFRGLADTNRRMATVQNFSDANSRLLQSEQDLAQIATPQKTSIWGPLLSAGGQLMTMFGGSGMAPSGSATVSDPTFGGFSRAGQSAASVKF